MMPKLGGEDTYERLVFIVRGTDPRTATSDQPADCGGGKNSHTLKCLSRKVVADP